MNEILVIFLLTLPEILLVPKSGNENIDHKI